VIVVPDGQSGIKMLEDGRIDVYSLPILSIKDLLKKANDPDIEMVAPVKGAPVYCDGAAFRKQDTALRDAFDKELAAIKASGEFKKIVEPYGFVAETAMQTTREKLCGGEN
jgi:polar amino acid transport system substrate-binding protein